MPDDTADMEKRLHDVEEKIEEARHEYDAATHEVDRVFGDDPDRERRPDERDDHGSDEGEGSAIDHEVMPSQVDKA